MYPTSRKAKTSTSEDIPSNSYQNPSVTLKTRKMMKTRKLSQEVETTISQNFLGITGARTAEQKMPNKT